MKTTYALVYQGGIANIFEEIPMTDTRNTPTTGLTVRAERVRVLQDAFSTCETFCRGLRVAGATVRVAWCNEAGDIKNSLWHFGKFENAPFHDSFAFDFGGEGLTE